MTVAARGIHHITGIASDPQRNLNFYTGLLGLRLVKLTVNFDTPSSYHLHYGDEAGNPGTILTFFAWPDAYKGMQGTGQVAAISLAIPPSAYEYWSERLGHHGIRFEGPIQDPPERVDEHVLAFRDPDGLPVELVAHSGVPELPGWEGGPVPEEYAIRGLYTVTLWEDGYELTARLLTEALGFRLLHREGSLFRYSVDDGGPGTFVDLRFVPDLWHGTVGVGTVHHVAFRAADDETQQTLREQVAALRLNPTPVIDRKYFRSVYFKEPGGVLFELATDPPGFTVDEPADQLGTHLKLPSWLEPQRQEIERILPPIRLPTAVRHT